ncbi:MAG: hypothetical protein K6E40_10545 [Desulfovibrio sp.]|nr:hypothetical protein [Desulfovibrio sp.]
MSDGTERHVESPASIVRQRRADRLMYQEKKLLKSLGAITRDDAPAS